MERCLPRTLTSPQFKELLMNELITLEDQNVAEIFAKDGLKPILESITKKVEVFVPDLTTAIGRKEIASLANKVSKSKVYIDNLGKLLTVEWKEKSKVVDAERKIAREYLDDLRDRIRLPLTEHETKERVRIADCMDIIDRIKGYLIVETGPTAVGLEAFIHTLKGILVDESMAEFEEQAKTLKGNALERLQRMLSDREKYEAEQAELEELRKEKEIRAKKDHDEQIRKEATEKAKIEAEAAAERKAKDESDRVQREKDEDERIKQKAIQDRLDAESELKRIKKEQEEQKIQAEKQKVQAAKDEREKIEKEIKDLKDRQKKREEDLDLKRSVHLALAMAFTKCSSISEDDAETIIENIANGNIESIHIQY